MVMALEGQSTIGWVHEGCPVKRSRWVCVSSMFGGVVGDCVQLWVELGKSTSLNNEREPKDLIVEQLRDLGLKLEGITRFTNPF